MFSATIDQIRFRRAIRLPTDRQKVSSSGFQSSIHFDFARDMTLLCPRRVQEAHRWSRAWW
jgi:hypothetical protein